MQTKFGLSLLAIFFCVSCVNLESPQNVVESAAYALDKNKYSDFVYTLRDNAKTIHGNKKSFGELRTQIKAQAGIQIGVPEFLREEIDDNVTYNIYQILVFGTDDQQNPISVLWDIITRCVFIQETFVVPYPKWDESWPDPSQPQPGETITQTRESCRISELNTP